MSPRRTGSAGTTVPRRPGAPGTAHVRPALLVRRAAHHGHRHAAARTTSTSVPQSVTCRGRTDAPAGCPATHTGGPARRSGRSVAYSRQVPAEPPTRLAAGRPAKHRRAREVTCRRWCAGRVVRDGPGPDPPPLLRRPAAGARGREGHLRVHQGTGSTVSAGQLDRGHEVPRKPSRGAGDRCGSSAGAHELHRLHGRAAWPRYQSAWWRCPGAARRGTPAVAGGGGLPSWGKGAGLRRGTAGG